MADTELKKLNKTVDEAVNMLKVYIGNSAQIKNMNEKERQAIEKWFDVGEKAEENVKQQRAFTERERDENGRFFKKREAMAFNFMGIAKAVGGIFTSMAKGVGSAIGGIAKGITTHLSKFFSAVKSHFLGLFGEESEWFELLGSIKDSISGVFGWIWKGVIGLFRKTPKWATKMIDTLSDMYSLQIKEAKKALLVGEGKKKKLGIWGILGTVILLGAAVLAGWIKSKLMVINGILKLFRIDALMGRLKKQFVKFKARFPKIVKGFGTFRKKIINPILKFFKAIPGVSKLLGALKFGLKFLGWPLLILLGIIDFIKGWRATQGDWQDKLIGGLKSVLHGLLDFPLEILGWAWDWLMKQFGIESSGTGNKLKRWAETIFDVILEFGPFGILLDLIKGFTSDEGFAGVFKRKFEKFQGLFLNIIDLVINIWNAFLIWAAEKASWIPGAEGLIKGMALDRPENSPQELNKNAAKYYSDHEARKLGLQQGDEETKQLIREQTKATKNAATKTENAATAITTIANQQGGGGGQAPTEQIPDELDNYVMAIKNHSGDFD